MTKPRGLVRLTSGLGVLAACSVPGWGAPPSGEAPGVAAAALATAPPATPSAAPLDVVAALAREPSLTPERVGALLGVRLEREAGGASAHLASWAADPPAGPFATARLRVPRDAAGASGEGLDLTLREALAPDGQALVTRFGEPITQRPAPAALREDTGVVVVITYPLWGWEAAFGLGPPPGDRLRTVTLRREARP